MSRRRARSIDVAASALTHLLPRPFARALDQARLDATSIIDGLSGRRTPSFSTRESPITPPAALAAIDPLYELLPEPLARRYATLARDIRTVTRELRGDRSPPVVPRPDAILTRAASPKPTPARRALVVRSLVHETDDALAIELVDPTGRAIEFVPGQFLTLHVTIDDRELRRAYSISSAPLDGAHATIVVKKIPGGLVSNYLHDTLRVGDRIEVTGPSGSFLVPATRAPRHLVLFAGGSGITPIFSIVRTTLASEPGARLTLVFGNRRESDVIFRSRLDALGREHGERLRVVHVLEEPSAIAHTISTGVVRGADATQLCRPGEPGTPVVIGRPDAAMVARLVADLALDTRMPGEDAPLFFVCGPAPMMASVRGALGEAGVPDARIREERFLSPVDPSARRVENLPTTPQPITIRRRAATGAVRGADATQAYRPGEPGTPVELRTFEQRPDETILEAATRAGVELPSSCTMGGCGACRCRAVSGEVVVDEPSCLTDAERAEGLVLTCVGRARGPVTLELP